jgi:hypothetical protein
MPRRLALAALGACLLLTTAPVIEPAMARNKAKQANKRPQPPPFLSDTSGDPNFEGFWGEIQCDNDQRHQWMSTGGDSHPTITGEAQGNDAYRRVTVFDGDEFWGERCELGDDSPKSPTTIYREGSHWITQMSVRLPTNFPLDQDMWQVIMQMKQTGAANSGGTPVIELDAYDGAWRLRQSLSPRAASDSRELWAAPLSTGRWTRFSFDMVYSRMPWRGSINVSVDLNGDSDFLDPGEQSGTMRTYTLKVELPGGDRDGVKPGTSIPSHLSAGVYHNEDYDCPSGCYVDLDNVQLLRVGA